MIFNRLNFVQNETYAWLKEQGNPSFTNGAILQPSKQESVKSFFSRVRYAIRLIFLEKEILLFAILHWVFILASIYFAFKFFKWIPKEVRDDPEYKEVLSTVFIIWVSVIIFFASFFIGIFAACMGAAHFIHKQQRPSYAITCFKLVMQNIWSLWLYSFINAWVTVMRYVNYNSEDSNVGSIAKDLVYYAWKIGTIGVLPGLIAGKDIITAGQYSIGLIKAKFFDLVKLKIGYTIVSWMVGIVTFFSFSCLLYNYSVAIYGTCDTFVVLMGVAVLLAFSTVQVLIRPLYIIILCDIYYDFITEKGEKLEPPPADHHNTNSLFIVMLIVIIMYIISLFKHQIMGIISLLHYL